MALTQAQFNTLVEEHGPALYRLAYRLIGDCHEAEDLVQEAFRSAWRSRMNYEPGRGDRAWLAAMLRRRAVDRWRKHRPTKFVSPQAFVELGTTDQDPSDSEFSDEVQEALGQLPRQLRETLLIVAVGELTHQETADLLGIPIGTVLSRVARARSRLRKLLIGCEVTK